IPVFFNAAWLYKMSQKHPDFNRTLSQYATLKHPLFPLSNKNKNVSDNNIISLALLLAWLLSGIAFAYDPAYSKSFNRYFTAHLFYVVDVMKRHIRSTFSGIIILI